MVSALEGHPSVAGWVAFSDGAGQHRTKEVAQWLERRDPTRLVNAASGCGRRGAAHSLSPTHAITTPLISPFCFLGEMRGDERQ